MEGTKTFRKLLLAFSSKNSMEKCFETAATQKNKAQRSGQALAPINCTRWRGW